MESFPGFDLSGKRAIITGAARGLGKAIAAGISESGGSVLLTDIHKEQVQKAADEIKARFGGSTYSCQVDVTDKSLVDEMVRYGTDKMSGVDILVNNAGITRREEVLKLKERTWDKVIEVNLKGIFLCSQRVAQKMVKEGKGGKIINISSIGGLVGLPGTSAYCASKGGVEQFTKTLALELAPFNIQVNSVAPCHIRTSMTEKAHSEESVKKNILPHIPMGRMAETGDIVGGVIYLASDSADMVTGHALSIDGGWVAK